MGVVVNAVTKSGTNRHSGTMSGYFRDSDWAAKDAVENRVDPVFEPAVQRHIWRAIRRDRIHVFANYEYEREPQTAAINSTLYPIFNVDLHGVRTQNQGGVKVDTQFTPQMRLSSRVNAYTPVRPDQSCRWRRDDGHRARLRSVPVVADSSQVVEPVHAGVRQQQGQRDQGRHLQVRLGHHQPVVVARRPTAELPGRSVPIISDHTTPDGSVLGGGLSATLGGSPRIQLSGYNIGTPTNLPQTIGQRTWQVRDDFTWTFDAGGRHDVRMGGEFLEHNFHFNWCSNCNGNLQANAGGAARRPTQAQLAAMFPDMFDWSTWNYNGLNPLSVVRFRQSVGNFRLLNNRHAMAGWYQDDWRVSQRLTLNLGVRWDADLGDHGREKAAVALDVRRPPAPARLVAAAAGVRLQLRRPDGGARRLRHLLHAIGERRGSSVEPQYPDDHPRGRIRWPR